MTWFGWDFSSLSLSSLKLVLFALNYTMRPHALGHNDLFRSEQGTEVNSVRMNLRTGVLWLRKEKNPPAFRTVTAIFLPSFLPFLKSC